MLNRKFSTMDKTIQDQHIVIQQLGRKLEQNEKELKAKN